MRKALEDLIFLNSYAVFLNLKVEFEGIPKRIAQSKCSTLACFYFCVLVLAVRLNL